VVREYEDSITRETYTAQVLEASNKRLMNLRDTLPEITLTQFLSAIRGATYDGKIN